MSDNGLFGFSGALPEKLPGDDTHFVMHERPLQKVLAFSRYTLDDVINSRFARNRVYGYYKLHRWIQRGCEVRDLERQWNELGK